ncbi:MAG: hypothetical protein WCE82_10570 [Halobacteriota archaeon]
MNTTRRTVIATAMVAIMALSACGAIAVTTSPKVAAASASTQPTPIDIAYRPGAKYIFAPIQFNNDGSSYNTRGASGWVHSEAAFSGFAFSAMRVSPAQQSYRPLSWATTGVLVQMRGSWWSLSQEPCKITMHLSYNLVAKGGAEASVSVSAGNPQWDKFSENRAQSGTQTVTFVSTVGDVFYPQTRETMASNPGAEVLTIPFNWPPGSAGSASAVCHLDYIIIEFPQALG